MRFFFLLFFAASVHASDEKTDKIDSIFAPWNTTTTPGAVIAVIKDGKCIYERGYGMAKLEEQTAEQEEGSRFNGQLAKE